MPAERVLRIAALAIGSSRDNWLFTGINQIHATIPLEILNPFTGLFEEGHACSAAAGTRAEPGDYTGRSEA